MACQLNNNASVATLDNLARPRANELPARIVTFILQEKHLNG